MSLQTDVVRDNKAEDIRQHFEQCFEFIDGAKEAGGAVLVHCIVGKSRRYFPLHVDHLDFNRLLLYKLGRTLLEML